MTNIVYLKLMLDYRQETNPLVFELKDRFCDTGRFCGAYELKRGDTIIPVLMVGGMGSLPDIDLSCPDLGNTHLVIIVNPNGQFSMQPCSPFTSRQLSTSFSDFRPLDLGTDEIPTELLELAKLSDDLIFLPHKSSGNLKAITEFPEKSLPYYSWNMSGLLAFDRKHGQFDNKEPVLYFDPEIIIDSGTGRPWNI